MEYPELQKAIRSDVDARSVRLDVYVNDGKGSVYDIEMQTTSSSDLPRRSRYYQCIIDLQLLDKGQPYKKLNNSFVIFICLFDVFGGGRHKYTFVNTCSEDRNIRMGDGTTKIFLNASGQLDDVSGELKAFLDYAAGKPSKDVFVQKLEKAVREAKKNRKWRHEYMTLLMRDQENIEKGREEGREEGITYGEERLSALIARLSMVGQTSDILRVTTDKEYRKKLYEEFLIP